jgi:hypothetical protein
MSDQISADDLESLNNMGWRTIQRRDGKLKL